MQALSSFERLVVLLTSCHIVGVAKAQPHADVQRGNYKPINCYFCDTQLHPDCDSRLEDLKQKDTYKSRTGPCEWVVPRPFRNNLIGIPLRPYCLTFIERVKDYGKEINYRMVRDCGHPGGLPTDCMQFNLYPNMLTWPKYKEWVGWENDPRFSVFRQAVFCNDSDYCNQMKQAEFELKCNTGALRALDGIVVGNSSAAATRGASWLYAATLIMPAMLASRSESLFHHLPLLMAAMALIPRVGLFAHADFLQWQYTAPIALECYFCDTASAPDKTCDGVGLKGTHSASLRLTSMHVSDTLAASLGLVNRLDPVCVTYLLQEYKDRRLYAQYVVRRGVLMEGFPEECMNLTDVYTKRNKVAGYTAVHIAKFCWTNRCNDITQEELVDECYPKISQGANRDPSDAQAARVIITNEGWRVGPSAMRAMNISDITETKPGQPAPPEGHSGNGTGGSASLFVENQSIILLLSVLLAVTQGAFSFKVLRMCGNV